MPSYLTSSLTSLFNCLFNSGLTLLSVCCNIVLTTSPFGFVNFVEQIATHHLVYWALAIKASTSQLIHKKGIELR